MTAALALCTLLTAYPAVAESSSEGIPPGKAHFRTETWRAVEISFQSSTQYKKPLFDAELDVVFTSPEGKEFVVPGFWDGRKTWRVRFAPTEPGEWKYVTKCSNPSDSGLHGMTGSVLASPYGGKYEIYRRGFLKTEPGVRYFMYADGTPFFYLGDTHWSMMTEPFEEMFKKVVNERVAQGFTVYQSEPLKAHYDLSNGVDEGDLAALHDMDRRFQFIADAGLVHANAQFFFASEIARHPYTDDSLARLCRMWVARYGAYPVLWTTAQEVDNDFYFDAGKNKFFDAKSNPWKKVLEWIHKYDPWQHPGSAHMELAGGKPEPKEFPPVDQRPKYGYGVLASTSSFREVPGHTWYAVQWSPPNNAGIPWFTVEDFWKNGQGKPVVDYEGHYDHLWTLEDGARQQGWTAYLNGMCGQGYGAIDIWYYKSEYDMKEDSVRGAVTITVQQKQTKWQESLNFPAARQLGIYMKKFLQAVGWWKLVPRFGDKTWFEAGKSAWYSLATIDDNLYVLYLYNWSTKTTGTLGHLRNEPYTAQWFNPRTGEYSDAGTFTPKPDKAGEACRWPLPEKPTASDWVLLVTAQKGGNRESR